MAGFNKTGAVAPDHSNVAITNSSGAVALDLDSVRVEIEGTVLLDQINMHISAGSVTAIVGPNGAGKSTLIRAISGEQKLTSGAIRFHDQSIKDWPAQNLARYMAVLPQRSLLNFGFTAREVVELARTPHDSGISQDRLIVDDVLAYLDAEHLADRLYPNLSGGEQQRIQLARVLAQIWCSGLDQDSNPHSNPHSNQGNEKDKTRLMLLDEPSSYFDLAHQQLLVQLVRELAEKKGMAIVVVLHDLNMAMSCADNIAVICCGQLHGFGAVDDVLNQKCIEDVFGVHANFLTDQTTGMRHISVSYLSRLGGSEPPADIKEPSANFKKPSADIKKSSATTNKSK